MTRDLKRPEFFSRKIFQIIAFSISIFLFLALFLFQAISHYTIYLSVYLPVLSLPISLYMSLSFFISMSHCSLYHLFLPLSLYLFCFLSHSISFFLFLSLAFSLCLPPSYLLLIFCPLCIAFSQNFANVSIASQCVSMLKLSSSLSVMFSSYFYLKLICDSFYLIYFVSTNLSLPPNIFFLLHSSES